MTEELTKPKRKHPHRKDYNAQEIEQGLIALAFHNGNSRAASKACGIPDRTLYDWGNKLKVEEYERVRREQMARVREHAAQRHMEAADVALDLEREAAELTRKALVDIPARDLPAALRNISTTGAIHTDKARELRGEASTHVIEHRSVVEIRRSLKSKGFDLELEATDVTEVSESHPSRAATPSNARTS